MQRIVPLFLTGVLMLAAVPAQAGFGLRNSVGDSDDEKSIKIRRMTSHIGRDPSCSTCHILGLRDFGSPGQIRMYDTEGEVNTAMPPLAAGCPNDAPHVTRCPEDRL